MRTLMIIIIIVLFTASGQAQEVTPPFEHLHAHESIEKHLHAGWESRYFSEGRDALDGKSLWATGFELGWNHLSGGLWYGLSSDQDYDELQLTLGRTGTAGDFEFYVAYTHFQFPEDGLHDNEIGIGGNWSGLPLDLELATDGYYSFDAEGSFWELALNRGTEISDYLSLVGSTIVGMNQGYVSDGHDGANHLALRTEAEYAMTGSLSVTAHTTYSWALSGDKALPGDDQLIDLFHGGVTFQWSF
jgi:hypothetical protein